MTGEQMIDVLNTWQTTVSAAESRLTALAELVGSTSEQAFFDAQYRALEAYTRLVADTVDFDCASLVDFWMAHDFGKKPMKLIRKVSGAEFWIRGVGDLVGYIECVAAADARACPPCNGNCNQGRECVTRKVGDA